MISESKPDSPGLADYLRIDFADPEQMLGFDGINISRAIGSVALHDGQPQERAAGSESVASRLLSEENMQLGVTVQMLLEPAYVTYYFKNLMVVEVCNAHSQERRVAPVIAPSQLRIDTGPGIFDPLQAPEIEAECIREWYASAVARHSKIFKNIHYKDVPVILDAHAFENEWRILMDWSQAYLTVFLRDPFIGFDLGRLRELSGKVSTHDEADRTRWEHTIAALERIREQYRYLDSNDEGY